jgi:hypothetical protein
VRQSTLRTAEQALDAAVPPQEVTMALEALAWMLIGHAVADYPLQGEWIARAKNHCLPVPCVPGETIWPGVLLSHAAIHAGAVKLATGSWTLAAAELIAHTIIDHTKCSGRLTYNQDQAIHVACKVAWAIALYAVPGLP